MRANLEVREQEAADQARQRRRQHIVKELGEQARQQWHFVQHDLYPSAARHFSNDRLNFKHAFWAAKGPEKGIFAALPGISCGETGFRPAAPARRPPSG